MTAAPAVPGQRSRILDAALTLMSEHGSAGTSMRRLAGACDLNVATIYHYFPSKADLLRAVIAERRYGDRLAGEQPPVDLDLPAADRMRILLTWIWEQTEAEHRALRLIVGEGLRGDETARSSARSLIHAVDLWLADLLERAFPELAGTALSPAGAARLVRGQLLGLVAQKLAVGEADSRAAGDALASALFDGDTQVPGPAAAPEVERRG